MNTNYLHFFITCSFVLFFNNIMSQNLDSLNNQYYKNKLFKIDTIINKKIDNNKLKYLSLLPNVSLGQNPINGNFTINIGISLSSYINYLQQKENIKIQSEILKSRMYDQAYNEFLNNQNKIELLELDKIKIKHTAEIIEIWTKKKQIIDNQYKNNEITLDDYLSFSENYINKIHTLDYLNSQNNIKINNLLNFLQDEK